jgi:PAS domain S-box-containing protein
MTQVGEHARAIGPSVPSLSAGRRSDEGVVSSTAYLAADASGGIVEWSDQAEHLFGWDREAAVGRLLVDTVVAARSVAPVADAARRLLASALGPAGGLRTEFEAATRWGDSFSAEATMWAGGGGGGGAALHVLVNDVSERRRTVDNLYRMAALVYALDEAILGVSLDGHIVSWNSGAVRTFGYQRFEVVGKDLSMLVPPAHHDEVRQWWVDMREGARRYETEGLRRNSVIIDLAVTVSPIRDGHGQPTGVSIIARDITEQRWMASTLEATLRSLEDALKESRESESRCRRFLADAAHQLRTPIAGIRACAETLLRGAPPARRDELLLDVVRETSRAGRVMTGLLRMARVDQGETLTLRECDLVGVCAAEVERFQALAPDLEIGMRATTVFTSPPQLDAEVVREILANVLDNARRHASRRIELVVGADDGHVEIRVDDDGPGLPPADVERAFERFISLDGGGGSGLGLPIAKGLAKAHGGDLEYQDGFVLRLPRTAPAVDCGGAARPAPRPA